MTKAIASVRALLTRNLLIGLVTFLLCGPIFFGTMLWMGSQPAVVVTDLSEEDGVAIRGGMLDLHGVVQRSRICPVRVERWLWQPVLDADGTPQLGRDGKPRTRWVGLDHDASPPLPVGQEDYIVEIPVPPQVEPGLWYYRGRAQEQCSWLARVAGLKLRDTHDVPVRIENPSAAEPATAVIPPAPVELVPAGRSGD
jgi:hypothetical protein